MDLSGQALENFNQLMKREILANRRQRTGAVPKQKIGKGVVQQMAEGFLALQTAKAKMKGTKRQIVQEKTGGAESNKTIQTNNRSRVYCT